MHDGPPPRDDPGARPRDASAAAPDLQALARDWITLWQSELTAAAADRELQETWQTLASLWAGAAAAMLHGLPRGGPDVGGFPFPAGGARAAAPARPASAAAAPDARDAEIDRLARRIAELERRLADLERGSG
jgi:hypothetical protein